MGCTLRALDMYFTLRTLLGFFTAYIPKPEVPDLPQARDDPDEPQDRVDNIEIPQVYTN